MHNARGYDPYGTSSNGGADARTTGQTGPRASLSQVNVRTIGLNSNAIYGQAGAQVVIDDSFLATSGGGRRRTVPTNSGDSAVTTRNLTNGAGGIGGSGLNATGGTIDSANTFIVNAARPAMTLSASGGNAGTLISNGDTLYTGVLLGTNLAEPAFGRPIDAGGNAIADPASFVASGLTGHGVFAGTANGHVWMNVDPATGAPTGMRSGITTLGNVSEGVQHLRHQCVSHDRQRRRRHARRRPIGARASAASRFVRPVFRSVRRGSTAMALPAMQ